MTNESKWLTAISGIVAAVVPLLVAYGIITAEQGELWSALALAIVGAVVAIVVPVTVTSLAKNYNDNQVAAAAVELEHARLMAGLRELGYGNPAASGAKPIAIGLAPLAAEAPAQPLNCLSRTRPVAHGPRRRRGIPI